MKQTLSDIITTSQDGCGTTNSTIKTFLTQRINRRYEVVTDKLNTWTQVISRSATSGDAAGDDQQYYNNPPNLREIESIVVTLGGQDYPLKPVYSQGEWNRLNATVVAGNIPERYFRRTNDYGIWPTPPEDDATIVINYTQRAVPLYFEDYTTGTATVTENDATVTIATGVTTTFKAGFWFSLATSAGEPRGTWYQIDSITSSTVFELTTVFEESTEAAVNYIVGQVPNIPEEGMDLLAIGAISDFYALKQKDMETAIRYDNFFWTGNYNVTALQAKKDKDYGGLLALIDAYADRDGSVFVERNSEAMDVFDFQRPRTVTLSTSN